MMTSLDLWDFFNDYWKDIAEEEKEHAWGKEAKKNKKNMQA